jgi:hypothetical protein
LKSSDTVNTLLLARLRTMLQNQPTNERPQKFATEPILLRYNCDTQPLLWPIIALRFTPVPEASARLIEDFENEIRAEFVEYFDDAQRYLNCLNAAARSGNADINAALSRYRVLFP